MPGFFMHAGQSWGRPWSAVGATFFLLFSGMAWADASLLPPVEPNPAKVSEPSYLPGVESPSESGLSENKAGDSEPKIRPFLLPYYFSAYLPAGDQTELNLALLLSATPGVAVALGWGVTEETMLRAKMTVQGASHTAALRAQFRILDENPAGTSPAVCGLAGWQYVNHREFNEDLKNIFRGNRLQAGVTISKDLGILGRALRAGDVNAWLKPLSLHAEVTAEYQTGREQVQEDPVSRAEIGARVGLQVEAEPERLYFLLVYDTLPDWLAPTNYYLGGRYYYNSDFALDLLAGRIGLYPGVTGIMTWIF